MSSDAVNRSFEQLAQDAMDGNLPAAADICKDCSEKAVPFSLNGSSGPRDADEWLGIPSTADAATMAWFTENPWIRDPVQNFHDTYLERVLDCAGEQYGDAWLAEFYAFQASYGLEIHCIQDDMEDETFVTPRFLVEISGGKLSAPGEITCGEDNFIFLDHRIYYWSFTSARFSRSEADESAEENRAFSSFDWSVSGLFDPRKAAQALKKNHERAVDFNRLWTRVKGAGQILFGVLSIIPAVGAARGLFGVYKAVAYSFAVIDGALSANAIASGSTQLITGEGIDYGENLFESLGKMANPENGAERGRQVFMMINLAMLTPSAFGGARWLLRKIRKDVSGSARLDLNAVSEAERRRLAGHTSAEPLSIELRGSRPALRKEESGNLEWLIRPSLDTNRNQIALTTATGRANYSVMSTTFRDNLKALIIQNGGSLKVTGRACKVVGDAGEEALAAMILQKWKVEPKRILGYSDKPGVPSRFGLTNKSGHGLDMLVWVPPPPSLTVRNPSSGTMRHSLDSLHTAPTHKMEFTEDTLLIIETKATLGGTKTPGFNKTQGTGAGKFEDLRKKIEKGSRGWSKKKMLETDPRMQEKVDALDEALALGKIKYLHSQVFFDSKGKLNKLVGDGSGIQINTW